VVQQPTGHSLKYFARFLLGSFCSLIHRSLLHHEKACLGFGRYRLVVGRLWQKRRTRACACPGASASGR
jgi:hypothetical protein